MTTIGHHGLLLASNDVYAGLRVTIANLDVNLFDPKRTWTANGGANVSAGWLNLDGAGDYLSTPNSADFNFGAGDFCLEAFVEIPGAPGAFDAIFGKWQTASLGIMFGIDTSRRLVLYWHNGALRNGNSTATVAVATPTHVAAYRFGASMYCAIGGVTIALATAPGTLTATTQQQCIGAESMTSASDFNGKIRGFRATKGSSGGYGASNFTPPTFPLPLT